MCWLVAIFAVVLLFYVAVGYIGSADMFGDHSRWRGMNRGPADFGLRSETVSFDSTDGIPMKAWWLPASGTPRGTVIIAHGIDHTRQVMLPRATFLVHGGYDVLTPDLRCHGESGGTVISDGAFPTGKGLSEDISGHFLHDPKANFLVRVLSLMSSVPGAARATALVYYLRSGVYLGPDLLSVMPSASRIRVPVLLISGQEDWIVPTDRARQILAVLPGDQKELLVIPGAHHDTTYSTAPELYGSTVLSFLDRAIKSN